MADEGVFGFLKVVDNELAVHAVEEETLELFLIGRSALILGYGLHLMTKDVDIVETKRSRLFTLAVENFKKEVPGTDNTVSTLKPSHQDSHRCRWGLSNNL